MEAKKVSLSIYKNSMETFHVHRVSGNCLAQVLHYHDYFQIYYIIKGNITHFIYNKNMNLSYGDVFIIPPGYPHHISMNVTDTEFYSFSFTKEFLDSNMFGQTYPWNFLLYLSNTSRENIKLKILIPSSYQLHFESLMNLMMHEYELRDEGSTDVIQGSLVILLTVLSRIYFHNSQNDMSLHFEDYKQATLYCIEYLKKFFMKKITIEDMVHISRMPRGLFCKTFAELTGLTFNDMLNKLRIDKYIELLKDNKNRSYTLSKIASICGYTEFSTFYRNFRKFTGISPSEYMKVYHGQYEHKV